MATQRCLLIVADYPYVESGGRVFAEIPWDDAFARLYHDRFSHVLLLGRLRRASSTPPGWVAVDQRLFTVVDAGDWSSVGQFLLNLPRLFAALRGVWSQVGVLHCKLFYLNSVAAWVFNRLRSRDQRRPVATLLVGDAAEAIILRDDLLPFPWMRTLASGLVAWIIRAIQRRVDIAGYVAQFLVDKFDQGHNRTVVISESWLHDAQIHRHDRTRPRSPGTVLFVGRLIPRKRPRLLLEGVSRLTREGADLRCVFVGDGPERAALETLTRVLKLESRVRFVGWLGLLSPAMLDAYDDADIFCLPSYAEGLPLVLVEAMGRGAAVIATQVSGTPEIVVHGRTGLLIPRDDVDALAAAIRRYLSDPVLWRACIDGGYDVAARYTFEAQRGMLADAIGSLAS